MIKELVKKARSYRRFYQNEQISEKILRELIDLARLGGSAINKQPLKYMIVNTPETNARIFDTLGWAGLLPDWSGPEEGERPSAYIICFLDTSISERAEVDLGIATQNILLGAVDRELGGCRIGNFTPEINNIIKIPENLKVMLVIALGKPKEKVIVETMPSNGDFKYWRDEEGIHYVPKRSLEEVLVKKL